MSEPRVPKLFTLAEVCEQFKGKIGKTALVLHIRAVPYFAGGPTHRRIGAKYLFTEDDMGRIVESLAHPEPKYSGERRSHQIAAPSEERAFERALALLSTGQKGARRARESTAPSEDRLFERVRAQLSESQKSERRAQPPKRRQRKSKQPE